MKSRIVAVVTLSVATAFAQTGTNAATGVQANVQSSTSVQADQHQPGAQVQVQAEANASAKAEHSHKHDGKDSKSANGHAHASGAAAASLNKGSVESSGTVEAVLSNGLNVGKNKVGDVVTAKTTTAATINGVVVPKGSKLIGKVTEAKARTKSDTESKLGIRFERIRLKDGRELPLSATIQAVAAARQMTTASIGDDPMMSGSGTGSAAVAGRSTSSGGGLLGGVTNTVSTVTQVGGNLDAVTSGLDGTVNSTTGAVLNANSTGALGLKDIQLTNAVDASAQTDSTLRSTSRNVQLGAGTQMVLKLAAASTATAGTATGAQ